VLNISVTLPLWLANNRFGRKASPGTAT